ARTVFPEVNHHVLDDPRVHLIVEDGRNVLLTHAATYDVVSIELTSVWFAGAGNLYNKEFYELVSKRLDDGGVLQQWFQLHHTSQRIVATTIASMRAVFPHVMIVVTGHQGQLLASKSPFTVSRDALYRLEDIGYVRATLESGHLVDYVKRILIDDEGVDRFIQSSRERFGLSAEELVSRDDNMALEYATPRTNVPSADDIDDTVRYLSAFRTRQTLPNHLKP
ncbi:MAG: speE2, partial [Labilithrix sp.]|nr:speE2 [Labilithrix sp.]